MRILLAALALAPPTATVEDGALLVVGTPRDDTVTVTTAGRTVSVRANGLRVERRGVRVVSVLLRGGNDTFVARGRADVTVNGGAGDDDLRTGLGAQLVRGGAGNDRLDPGRGTDLVLTGAGHDVVDARDGHADRVDCGRGRDRVTRDELDALSRC